MKQQCTKCGSECPLPITVQSERGSHENLEGPIDTIAMTQKERSK